MKLYSIQCSPFAARCRMTAYIKDIDLPIEEVSLPLPEDFSHINPLGKIPVLEVDGKLIAESSVICEYLEEQYPQPPLLPHEPVRRADVRVLIRVCDLYIMPLIDQLYRGLKFREQGRPTAQEISARLDDQLRNLQSYMGDGPFAAGKDLSLGDCTLVPTLFYIATLCPLAGNDQPFTHTPTIARYYDAIAKVPVAARVCTELAEGLQQTFFSN